MLDDEVKNSYPSQDVLDKCDIFVDLGDNLKLYDDAWMNIKTK